ncbi:hypothetical protein B0A55_07074 [Friedmanniomyces simplex]|uniref:Amino acid permease/ SLC12A domain-containing protein n=1 Tax=Friedmanniomyces simplex TaxID=329884 RepID=A0A4U0X2J9_9PEZI|nr:hypothetical protein B0A55_07074 [Friedmanniomyces simplex]
MAQREREGDVLGATQQDLAIMAQMGKRQQLRRIFSFLPTLALAVTLLASWESVAEAFPAGLNNGGPVSLVHDMILSFSSTLALAASLTEMASMCPIAGRWHGTLLMWAVVGKLFAVNVWAIQLLPVVELIGGICHGVFFVMLLVTLVALAPPSSADFFATDFVNGGGWSSDGVSWCIGLLTLVYCFVGFDGALHMSEEVQDSPRTVPEVLAFAFLIALLFCIGNVSEVLSTLPATPS